MQSDDAAGPEDDLEIVDLELAEPEAISEVDPASIFSLTIVAFVLTAVAIVQMPRGDFRRPPRDFAQKSEERSLQTDSVMPAVADVALVPRDALPEYINRPVVMTRYRRAQKTRTSKRTNDPFAQPAFKNLSLAEKLQQPLTLQCRASFEVIIQLISDRTGIPIQFHFQDLRADGIQKIRIIELDSEQQSIESVLCEALRQCNPDRTESVDEIFQCLVYVIAPDEESLILTSRRKAGLRGALPDVFKPAS